MGQLHNNFHTVLEIHAMIYKYIDEGHHTPIGNWEDVHANDFYKIEEETEDFVKFFQMREGKMANDELTTLQHWMKSTICQV